VLLLASEAADNARLTAEVRADFATIVKNVRLEARLIDDLLDLTRISRGKVALDLRAADVHGGLEDALAMAREEIEAKQITVTLKLEAARHVVLGDDTRLKQIFWNVIKNAAKFTPAAGRIHIATAMVAATEEVSISVTDTGIGMTPAELKRIFEAFSQGDHAAPGSTSRFEGVGLGLAISRVMVEMHSGSIRATSPGRDQGTMITIKLPLLRAGDSWPAAAPAGAAVPALAAAEKSAADGPRRILLVEDHRPTSEALVRLLTRRNYQVVAAASLEEARTAAGRGTFDLLISDIGLPDGNGYDLMTELRSRHGVAGIALTGYGMQQDISRSHAAGFVAHLTKPIGVQALESALALAHGRATSTPKT